MNAKIKKIEPSPWDREASLVSDEDANDILVAAIEGGTGYWAEVHKYMPGSVYSTATIVDISTYQPWFVASNTMAWKRAIVKAAAFFDVSVSDFIENHDAGYADVAMQIYTHGKVVYG